MYNMYYSLPNNAVAVLSRWVRFGAPLGSFYNAVVSNDLIGACGQADEENQAGLVSIVALMHNCIPADCHHSKERVAAWIERGGLQGMQASSVPLASLLDRYTPRYCQSCHRWVFVEGDECRLCGALNIDPSVIWKD